MLRTEADSCITSSITAFSLQVIGRKAWKLLWYKDKDFTTEGLRREETTDIALLLAQTVSKNGLLSSDLVGTKAKQNNCNGRAF